MGATPPCHRYGAMQPFMPGNKALHHYNDVVCNGEGVQGCGLSP